MSESQGGAGRREVAFRLFAAEYDDSDFAYSESDEERAPNYVVTPSGARVNRLFVVGVLTEVEAVSDDYLRARVVDPTGPFVVYAGQYQPEAMNFLERAEPPLFVAVTGKARTFQPEDSDRVYTSIRPESINEVDADTRDRWVVGAAEQTIDRVARTAEGKLSGLEGEQLTDTLSNHGVDDGLASGVPLALDHYDTTGEYLAAVRDLAVDAARVVAGERDEVGQFSMAPDDGTDDPLANLAERPIDVDAITAAADADEDAPDLSDAPEPDAEPSPTEEEIDEAVESADLDEPEGESETEEPTASTDSVDASPAGGGDSTDETGEGTDDTDGAASTEATDAPEASVDASASAADEAPDESAPEETSEDVAEDEDLEEFDGEFDLDEDERAEIEEEYGTEFQSGSEVDDPGEADIETPTSEPPAEPGEADALAEEGGEANTIDANDEQFDAEDTAFDAEGSDFDDETEDDAGAYDGEEPIEPDDEVETAGEEALDDAVMDAMADLDDGDGADRDAVIAEVVQSTGADPGAVEDAIQEALMDGRCYEPDDETLKAI